MKFTSEDLMKAMGLQVGDRVKTNNEILELFMDNENQLRWKIIESKVFFDLKFLTFEYIYNIDYEILPRPKRVGDLMQENEKLKQQVEDLENNQETVLTTLELAVNQNEKLKKAIEYEIELLIERRFNAYACDNYEVYNVIDAIIEELREVLGNV